MRILLVEDDESIREVLKMILETELALPDLSVDTASTGVEALEHAKDARPDLVLLDMSLEGEDGFDVFQRLRGVAGCGNLPVVAVTAHSVGELASRAQQAGFAGFVTKPIDFESSLFPLMKKLLVC